MKIHITATGNLENQSINTETEINGRTKLVFRMALDQPERRENDDEFGVTWAARDGVAVHCEYWTRHPEHVSRLLRKGLPVQVSGHLTVDTYRTKKTQESREWRALRIERIAVPLERIERVEIRQRNQGTKPDTNQLWAAI